MSFTSQPDLIRDLQSFSRVQDSEGFKQIDYERVINRAVTRHNRNYALSGSSSNIPLVEHHAIVLLAWSLLSLIRASKFAPEPSTSQGGFGTDRNSPYYKCMDLFRSLFAEYQEESKAIGLLVYAGLGQVVQGEVLTQSFDGNILIPTDQSPEPPAIILIAGAFSAGEVILSWQQALFNNFEEYKLFYTMGSTSLYQEWNAASVFSVPRLSSTAELLMTLTSQQLKSLKTTDLVVTPGTIHRFLLVCVSRSGMFTYSNEAIVTVPSP